MHKVSFKSYFLLFSFLFLCNCSAAFWIQLNSDNLFDYCEYYKFDGTIYETTILCNLKGIEWIEPWTFNWYDSVTNLTIMWNNIETLESNTFLWLDNLESLSISDNQIRNIEVWVFNWLPKLKQLDISHNQISTLENGLFNWLSLLEELSLRLNKISNLERWIFSWLPNLISLNLSENLIGNIKDWAFLWLDSLNLLNIGYNAIASIDDESFYSLNNLTNLTISMNCLDVNDVSRIENRYPNSDNLIVYNFEQWVCYLVEISPEKDDWPTSWPVIARLHLTWNESIINEQSHYLNNVPDLTFTENGTQTFIRIPSISYSRNWPTSVTVDWIVQSNNNEWNASNTWNNETNIWNNETNTWNSSGEPTWTTQETNNNDWFEYDYSKFNSNYSYEMNEAYQYAYHYGITTMNRIDNANMEGWLTRIAMAKMLSNYALGVLKKDYDTYRYCVFNDVPWELDAQYDNWVTWACKLWIMWVWINNFRPYDSVTRAEFATALSRLLYWTKDGTNQYYSTHISVLNNKWIISNTNPNLLEKRWYVMLMLMRAANKN